MKAFTLKKLFAATAAVAALSAAGGVMAAPSFTVNQGAFGSPYVGSQFFVGDTFNVSSSELVTFTSAAQTSGSTSGIILFNTLQHSGTPATNIPIIGSSGFYGLYLKFSFDVAYNATKSAGAPAGGAGAQYDVNNLLFQLYADPNGNDTYTTATTTTTSTVTDSAIPNDVLLASGMQIPNAALNTAGFNTAGAAAINSFDAFGLTAAGSSYFVAPSPFYSLAFTSQTNDSGSVVRGDATHVTIVNAGGTVTFLPVPEPSSVALFGIAALGMGLSLRRRKA